MKFLQRVLPFLFLIASTFAQQAAPPPRPTGAIVGSDAAPRDACSSGLVWREAFPDDHVCVTPQSRDQAASDNRLSIRRRVPRRGADTCRDGFVWREARPEDHVCVTPHVREQTADENRAAAGATRNTRFSAAAAGILDDTRIVLARPSNPMQPPPPRPDGDATVKRGFDENGDPYLEEALSDGSIRRQQDKGVTVIKPDGTSEYFPDPMLYSHAQPPTPPELPADPALGRAWMAVHNESLLGLIRTLVNDDVSEMEKFNKAETKAVGDDLFGQVEYRTKVLAVLAAP